jgi:hypothetical protein
MSLDKNQDRTTDSRNRANLMNQTIKLSGIKQFSQSQALVDDYSYQPNFILVDANGHHSKAVFGDIVPLYTSYDEVVSLIVTTWDSLYDFILHSSSFVICLLSIANQLINNAAYYTYLVVTAGYQEVMALPERFGKLKRQYTELLEVVSTPETRSLLWLEVKLDIQTALDKLVRLYNQVWNITHKFYLSFIVFACLGVLSFSSVLSPNSDSFLTSFLSNNTVVNTSSVITSTDAGVQEVASASAVQTIPVKKILEHTLEEGEDLSLISDLYAINVETIKHNNQLEGEPAVGDTLYIPWTEGYIYNTEKDVSPEQLAQLFEVDVEEVKLQNEALYNAESNTFAADLLVLIPTTDFAKVDANLAKEREREQTLKAIAEQEQRRQQALSAAAVSANTYKGVFADAPQAGTFTWPAQGSISRCVQPGHIACDLANFFG